MRKSPALCLAISDSVYSGQAAYAGAWLRLQVYRALYEIRLQVGRPCCILRFLSYDVVHERSFYRLVRPGLRIDLEGYEPDG